MPYHYITIEGNIGVGKTTLARLLTEAMHGKCVEEQFFRNPFLKQFYKDQSHYAFATEVAFLTERYHHIMDEVAGYKEEAPLFADYAFEKGRVFASLTLAGPELQTYSKLYDALSSQLPAPDLIIVLDAPVEHLLAQIRKRNRSFEKEIKADYLEKLRRRYQRWAEAEVSRVPLLYVETGQKDIVKDKQARSKLLALPEQTYSPGVHRMKL